ncbi:hypothetical protein IWZ01DRAFT_513883 [Phyllosticta capitalensis]
MIERRKIVDAGAGQALAKVALVAPLLLMHFFDTPMVSFLLPASTCTLGIHVFTIRKGKNGNRPASEPGLKARKRCHYFWSDNVVLGESDYKSHAGNLARPPFPPEMNQKDIMKIET